MRQIAAISVIALLIILLWTNQKELRTINEKYSKLEKIAADNDTVLFYKNRVIDSLKNVIFKNQ